MSEQLELKINEISDQLPTKELKHEWGGLIGNLHYSIQKEMVSYMDSYLWKIHLFIRKNSEFISEECFKETGKFLEIASGCIWGYPGFEDPVLETAITDEDVHMRVRSRIEETLPIC